MRGLYNNVELQAIAQQRLTQAGKDSDWSSRTTSAFTRIDLGETGTTSELGSVASIAVKLGKAGVLLQAWDHAFPNGELLPFREALNAAAHNDASLLELLAPEVQEPARQFLAMIAPKLLRQSME